MKGAWEIGIIVVVIETTVGAPYPQAPEGDDDQPR